MPSQERCHVEEPYRNDSRRRCYDSPTHDDDLYEDDLEWAIEGPQPRHKFTINRVDDDFRNLVRLSLQLFNDNLDLKAFLDWTTAVDHYFKWSNMPKHLWINFLSLLLVGPARLYLMMTHMKMTLSWPLRGPNPDIASLETM